jgi:hypothetical protein
MRSPAQPNIAHLTHQQAPGLIMSSKLSTETVKSPPSSAHAPDVEKAQAAADEDKDIVDWDGPNDPENPQNW